MTEKQLLEKHRAGLDAAFVRKYLGGRYSALITDSEFWSGEYTPGKTRTHYHLHHCTRRCTAQSAYTDVAYEYCNGLCSRTLNCPCMIHSEKPHYFGTLADVCEYADRKGFPPGMIEAFRACVVARKAMSVEARTADNKAIFNKLYPVRAARNGVRNAK